VSLPWHWIIYGPPMPPVTPIRKMDRRLPPDRSVQVASAPWPPFEGHRVVLGGDER